MPSPQDIIENAHRYIRVLGAAKTLQGEDLDFGLSLWNMMIGDWNTRKRFAWYIRNQAFSFAVSQQSYTFGPTGDFAPTGPAVSTRPTRIEAAKLVLTDSSPDTEYDLDVFNVNEYSQLSIPAQSSSLPVRVYYEPKVPNGVLYPHPYPTDTSNQLRLFWWHRLDTIAIADVATSIDLSDGYEGALMLSYAEFISPPYGKAVSPDLERLARMARANIQAINPGSEPPSIIRGASGLGMSDFLSRNF